MDRTIYKCLTCGGHYYLDEGDIMMITLPDWGLEQAFICDACWIKYQGKIHAFKNFIE